ncbi:MAG: hypothetical protein LC687_00855 [Actinobacteria bacterium]|nr:hypothetical protein [Actinomycetota bacterium]MCA1806405.1 hypothetical protein [Actinomycetota bacterium]
MNRETQKRITVMDVNDFDGLTIDAAKRKLETRHRDIVQKYGTNASLFFESDNEDGLVLVAVVDR